VKRWGIIPGRCWCGETHLLRQCFLCLRPVCRRHRVAVPEGRGRARRQVCKKDCGEVTR
jgi:hypothetical protein